MSQVMTQAYVRIGKSGQLDRHSRKRAARLCE